MSQRIARLIDPALLLLAAAALVAAAVRFGWLNDDALNYLALASRIADGHMPGLRPSWGAPYWAVFPFGYPLAIACVKWLVGDAILASKIANGLLFFGSIMLFSRWLRLPLLMVATLFTSLWMLEIVSYSWSENLFIFALALSLSSLARYLESARSYRLWLYALGLFLMVTSRYIGAVLLAIYMLGFLLYLRRSHGLLMLRIFAVNCAVAVVFAGYLYFNKETTGYMTGMYRGPSPEGVAFLTIQLLSQLLCSLWMLLPPLLLMWLLRDKGQLRPAPAYSGQLLLLVGAIYLVVLYVLRLQLRFEQFGGRMLTPGILLLGLGLLKMASLRWPLDARFASRVRIGWAAFFLLNSALLYRDLWDKPQLLAQDSTASLASYEARYGALADGTVLIVPGYNNPSVGWHFISPIFSSDRVFYALAEDQVTSFSEFRAWLMRLRYKEKVPPAYLFDFSELPTIQAFDKMVETRHVDPQLAAWMRPYFAPHRFVACTDCQPKIEK